MPSLREIKDRIGSVRSTLKITSAMKLVASAKLRKAQQAVQALRPYEAALAGILATARGAIGADSAGEITRGLPGHGASGQKSPEMHATPVSNQGLPSKSAKNDGMARVAVVAVASNSSLCGSFNGNIVRRTLEFLRENSARTGSGLPSEGSSLPEQDSPAIDLFPIGRRVADPLRRAGYPAASLQSSASLPDSEAAEPALAASVAPAPVDLNNLVAHPSYEAASAFAEQLAAAYNEGHYSRIVLIYNHFITTSKQEVRCETWLPIDVASAGDTPFSEQVRSTATHPSRPDGPADSADSVRNSAAGPLKPDSTVDSSVQPSDYIVEPSAAAIVATLLPQVLRLKIYAMLLDSIAAEHAARLIAMQTATDNAQEILDELTLEYNKGRQQQITAEILDIVGGSRQ